MRIWRIEIKAKVLSKDFGRPNMLWTWGGKFLPYRIRFFGLILFNRLTCISFKYTYNLKGWKVFNVEFIGSNGIPFWGTYKVRDELELKRILDEKNHTGYIPFRYVEQVI